MANAGRSQSPFQSVLLRSGDRPGMGINLERPQTRHLGLQVSLATTNTTSGDSQERLRLPI
jgi:hypothetical protein